MSKALRDLSLEDILKRFDALPHDKSGWFELQPLNIFLDECNSLDDDSIEEIQKSVRQSDLDKLANIFFKADLNSPGIMGGWYDWSAKFLALFARNKELELLKQYLSKHEGNGDSSEKIVSGLINNSYIATSTLIDLLCTIIDGDLLFYKENPDNLKYFGGFIGEATLKLRQISDDIKKESYLTIHKDKLAQVFDHILEFSMSNEADDLSKKGWIQSTYDIALILKRIGQSKLVRERIGYDLEDFTPPPNRTIKFSEPRRILTIKFVGFFGDPPQALKLMQILEKCEWCTRSEYEEEILTAFGNIGGRYSNSEEMIKLVDPLMNRLFKWTQPMVKDENVLFLTEVDNVVMSLRYLRALEGIQGQMGTAKYFASKAITANEEKERNLFSKVLSQVSDKKSAFAELKRFFFEGTIWERQRAQNVMSQMGLSDAVELLVAESNKQLYNQYVGVPIEKLEEKSRDLLESTVAEVKRGFKTINLMGVVVFFVGIAIIALGALIALIGHSDPIQLLAGGGSVLAGLATVLINFAKGPVKIVQRGLADLVQIETAFLGYIRRTGLASFIFLREYVQEKHEPSLNVFNVAINAMKEASTDTMALIEMYSGESEELRDFLSKDQTHLFNKVMPGPTPAKQKENE